MDRFFTFTGNLLAETSCVYKDIRLGATQRATSQSFQVGGKGVNAAKAAERMGLETCALIFAGGFAGARCLKWLEENALFEILNVELPGETREGLVAVSESGVETTFLGKDVPLSENLFGQALDMLGGKISSGDILAVCGSIPDFTARMAELLQKFKAEQKIILFADTYSDALTLIHPFADLIKVNAAEFMQLSGKLKLGDTLESSFRNFTEKFPQKLLAVTDGPNAAWFYDGNKISRHIPPAVEKEVSATGSGDVVTAGCAHFFTRNGGVSADDFQKCLNLASYCASTPGVAEFDAQKLSALKF